MVGQKESAQFIGSPDHQIVSLQKSVGNQAVRQLIDSGRIQMTLKIGEPGDIYEQEADRVADNIMQMPQPQDHKGPENEKTEDHRTTPSYAQDQSAIQKQPEEDDESLKMKPASEITPNKNETPNKREASHRPPPLNQTVGATVSSLESRGRPLSRSERDFFEPRFGVDFNKIRLHTEDPAAQTAEEINAKAFTVGNHVVFGKGRYSPGSDSGKRLMAHELVHTIQQARVGEPDEIQRDFAVAPTSPNRTVRTLTAAQIQEAVTFNRARHRDANEIALLRDILGLSSTPAVIDSDFVEAVVRYQAQYRLVQDGKIGGDTARRLAQEIVAEATFLGAGNLGSLAPEFQLKTNLQALVNANNRRYADYRNAIRAGTMIQRQIALLDVSLLRGIRSRLSWNNFARCVELLGRRAPSYNRLIRSSVVRAALRAAWTASNPAVPAVGTTQHEEGGWIYMNLFTGRLTTRRAPRGAGASISLSSPPNVARSIVVGMFHTHPNLGPGWTPGPSPTDLTLDAADGVPDIVVGSPDTNPATFRFYRSGPRRRRHLAGSRLLPGAAGGLAPQAKADRTYDER